ncbi:hypothetical protein QWA68_016422 [Fusarium oxysporum]|nr:hypothetical protein QWA68_016422 [Fusarium oxysporum]
MFERRSLQTLLDISEHHTLCGKVLILEICPHHLQPIDELRVTEPAIAALKYFEILCGEIGSREDTEAIKEDRLSRLNEKAYCEHLEDQEQLLQTGDDIALLKQAMKNLTRCESVYLTDGNPWGLEHLRERIGVYPQKSLSSKSSSTSEKLVEHMIQATLTAIAMSELHIQTLDISTGFQMNNARCIHPDMLIGSSALLSASPMKHLSRLYLVLDKHPGLGNTSKWAPLLVQFVESFPSLSHLCLGFDDSDDWGRFSELCKTLLIPKLEILSLRSINCASMDLAFFLLRHQRTLRRIQLDWVKLTDGIKSWRWLFEVVRDSLNITSLGTRGCSGQHSYAVPELEDIDAHCLTDILESMPI